QATARVAHPDSQADHQVSEDAESNGFDKCVVHFVVCGLQDVESTATVGGHIHAREPHQQNKEQTANQVANIDIKPVARQLTPGNSSAGFCHDNQHCRSEEVGAADDAKNQ